jgi:hypothetical protein
MLKDVKPGKYVGKALDGVFNTSADGSNPRIEVRFEFSVGDKKEKIIHKMFLGDKTGKDGLTQTERAFNTLYGRLGLDENKPFIRLSDGSDYFDHTMLADKQVELVIEDQTDKDGKLSMDKDGHPYKRIAWVNELGGGQLTGMPVAKVLGNVDLKAAAAAARARMGSKKAAPAAAVAEEEIPY